jgi:hypothetical protein
MYRIKNGKFAGRTMEQAMLRNAPDVYRIGAWGQSQADEKPNLRPFVREFPSSAETVKPCAVQGEVQRIGVQKAGSLDDV